MPTTRTATTHWEGTLFEGAGKVTLESSGLGTYDVSWPARTEEPHGKTSPEELIAAAHSSCFSMAFSGGLAKNDTPATSLDTSAEVEFTPGTGITRHQADRAWRRRGPRQRHVRQARRGRPKEGCPVSKALTGTTITLDAALA